MLIHIEIQKRPVDEKLVTIRSASQAVRRIEIFCNVRKSFIWIWHFRYILCRGVLKKSGDKHCNTVLSLLVCRRLWELFLCLLLRQEMLIFVTLSIDTLLLLCNVGCRVAASLLKRHGASEY